MSTKESSQRGHSLYRNFGKRALDILFSSLAIIALSPVFLVLTLLVRVKHGSPVFFSPTRPGMDERVFHIYKFRTMSNARDSKGVLLPDKDRITKLGNILRKTSLDELPELVNIFLGDMSFVGPRPQAKVQLSGYTEKYRERFTVRPGLTGLAQIHGRNGLPWNDRFQFDLDYVEKMSFSFDLKILTDTVLKVIRATDVTTPGTNKLIPYNAQTKIEDEGSIQPVGNDGKRHEIGGDFWNGSDSYSLDKDNGLYWLPKTKDSTLTFAGRAAIEAAIADILANRKIRRACVPAYCSFGMLQPFMERDIPFDFYDVEWNGKDLVYSFRNNKRYDVLLTMTYYSMDNGQTDQLIGSFQKRGGVVIEDITHSMFSRRVRTVEPDYYAASLRKWFPLCSGGWLGKTKGMLAVKPYIPGDPKISDVALSMEQMADYIGGKTDDKRESIVNRVNFEDWLVLLDCRTQMDTRSEKQLLRMDTERISEQRMINARRLFDGLKAIPEIVFLNKREDWDVCSPLYVPVLIEHGKRNALRAALAEQGIYCPVMWSERMGAPMSIRDRELSLVCDQRYTEKDMDRTILAISAFFRSASAAG